MPATVPVASVILFRKIRNDAAWDSEAAAPLLADGDVPADVLADLNTDSAALSVYEAASDIPVEMAAGLEIARLRNHPAKDKAQLRTVHFLRVTEQAVDQLVAINNTKGQTGYKVADALHRDLERFTGKKLLTFAHRLLTISGPGTVQIEEMLDELAQANSSGALPKSKLPKGLQEQLEAHLAEKQPGE